MLFARAIAASKKGRLVVERSFEPPWDDMMLIADHQDQDRTRQILFSTLRLAPWYIDCDYAAFVRHAYVAGLRREPEDEVSRTLPSNAGDIYHHRVNYLYVILTSEENQVAGYDAIVSAIPELLGSRNRVLLADMIRQVYPTITDLVIGLETLMGHVRENSRRQDMILASTVEAYGARGVAGARG